MLGRCRHCRRAGKANATASSRAEIGIKLLDEHGAGLAVFARGRELWRLAAGLANRGQTRQQLALRVGLIKKGRFAVAHEALAQLRLLIAAGDDDR